MPSRRRVLAAGCLALAAGAGCTGGLNAPRSPDAASDADGSPASDADRPTASDAEDSTTSAQRDGATTDDADRLRIAVTDGDGEVVLVTGADVATVGEVRSPARLDGYALPFTLTENGTEAFADGLASAGAFENRDSHAVRTYFGGELLYEAKLGPALAQEIESGGWNGEFLTNVDSEATAERLQNALEDGSATAGEATPRETTA